MAYDIEIQSENIVEETSKSVISVNDPTAEVIANQDNAAEVYSCTYVVVCDDIYIKNYIDNVPAWLQTYLENIANQAVSGTNISLANLVSEFQALESGYTATIASVSDSITQQNSTIDTLVTNTNNTLAGISQTLDTKITEAEASALMDQKIATFRDFGLTEASAWWQNIISTVITEQESQALQLSTLSSGMNNNSASVSNLSSAVTTLDSAVAKSSQYVTASVNGTTLITGFALTSAIDPEGEKISSMVFNANDFRIYTTTTIPDDTATPIFQAVGQDVWFSGKVTFQGLGIDSDSTTIDGGVIQTNTLSADRLKPTNGDTTIWEGGSISSADFDGNRHGLIGLPTTGFRLSSNAAGNSDDPTMYGAYIKGGVIEGTDLIGSTITLQDMIVRTDANQDSSAMFADHGLSGYGWELYAYDSTDVTKNKLRSNTQEVYFFGAGAYQYASGSYTYVKAYKGWIIAAVQWGGASSITVYQGDTTVATRSVSAGTEYTLFGMTFIGFEVTIGSGTHTLWFMKPTATLTMSGNGKIKVGFGLLSSLSNDIGITVLVNNV